MRRSLLLAVAALLVLAPAAVAAKRVLETVFQGATSATLSYDRTKADPGYAGLHVRVRRFNHIVVEKDIGDAFTSPARDFGTAKKPRSIALRNLDADKRLEVIVDTWTGGAHCCLVSDVWDPTTATKFRHVTRNWGIAGYRLRNVDAKGAPEFVSADTRFAGEIVPEAVTGGPIRIFQLKGGKFRPVTVKFPKTVRRNAQFWLDQLAQTEDKEGRRGALAAYAADKALLGEGAEGLARVKADPAGGDAFAQKLKAFLKKLHYPVD
jgi:hypothetical protein